MKGKNNEAIAWDPINPTGGQAGRVDAKNVNVNVDNKLKNIHKQGNCQQNFANGRDQLIERLTPILQMVPNLRKESSNSLCGPCPKCGGDDRFVYKHDVDRFMCRHCHPEQGGLIDFHLWLEEIDYSSLMIKHLELSQPNLRVTQKPALEYLISKRRISEQVVNSLASVGKIWQQPYVDQEAVVSAIYTDLAGGHHDKDTVQYIYIDGSGNKRFKKNSPTGKERFFTTGNLDKAALIAIVESVTNALTISTVFPDYAAIALGGSSLYRKASCLKPYKNKIVLAFDNDDAGKAVTRKINRLLGGVKTIKWSANDPKGIDINDLLMQGSVSRIKKLIDNPDFESNSSIPASETPQKIETNPEPVPLPSNLSPVAPFDFNLLPDTLRPWAQDIADRMQCSPDFIAVTIIVALGTVLGRRIGIRPQSQTNWTEVANFWSIIVGRPGVLKTPAMEEVLSLLKKLVAIANQEYQKNLAVFETEKEIYKLKKDAAEKKAKSILAKGTEADLLSVLSVSEPEPPALKRYIANDSTPSALAEILRQNPNGVLVYRDEVVSLLSNLEKEGQDDGRGFYLSGWSGNGDYTLDRIVRGLNLYIEAVCISLLGSTQPGKISRYLESAVKQDSNDDGLIQRCSLLVWPDQSGDWKDIDRMPNTPAKEKAFEVFNMLDKLVPQSIGALQDKDNKGNPVGIPYLRFDSAGISLFKEWRADLEKRVRSGELHPALESHLSKYRKLVPALALIIHLAEEKTSFVSERPVLKALAWADYLETHARRAYNSVTNVDVPQAQAILKKIKQEKLSASFAKRQILRPCWSGLTNPEQIDKGLKLLQDYGWLHKETVTTNGRPTTLYHLNRSAKL